MPAVAVYRHCDRFAGALDPQDRAITRAGSYQRIGLNAMIVLSIY